MPERRIPRDPSPEHHQGRAVDDLARGRGTRVPRDPPRQESHSTTTTTTPTTFSAGTHSIVVSPSWNRGFHEDNNRRLHTSDGATTTTATNQQYTETKQPKLLDSEAKLPRKETPPVAPGAVPATNQHRMAGGIQSLPDYKAQMRPMVSDHPPGANRFGQWVNHLPRFKNQVQTVLAPIDENPVEEIVEERFDPVTFKDQHRPHVLEHVVVPPTVPTGQQHHQHQRENQSQRNPLGEDTLFEPSSNGTTNSSRQRPRNANGHLPNGRDGGSNTSGLLFHAQAVDSRLEEERLQRAVRRELQSRPPVHAEIMEPWCSRRSTRIIALFTIAIVIIGVTIGIVMGLNSETGTPPTTATPSPNTATFPGPTAAPVSSTETPSSMPALNSRAVAIMEHINEKSFSSPVNYPLPLDPTPEELALDWLINVDTLQLTVEQTFGKIRLTQRFALRTLWFSTNGPEWTNKNGWLTDENECNWQGVVCNSQNLVTSIGAEDIFENNKLRGNIPADLALLSTCQIINLGLNPGIQGTIPASLTAMTTLAVLYFDGCQLTGAIPEDIGKLRNLTLLDLTGNLLTGSLPDAVGNLSNLELFAMANNQIMGTLSASIGNWKKLEQFSIFKNSFSGSLPSTISSWSNLQLFSVYENQFEGTLPPVNWPMLIQFYASGNAFSGTLSDSIGSFSRLQLFSIDGNRFTGTLPSSIGFWSDLESFWLAGASPPGNAYNFENRFEGTLPDSIGAWSLLTVFQIGIDEGFLASVDQTFTGSLPASIANWTRLKTFGVFNHQFTGSLPPTIGTVWSQMEGFNVANNSLTGTLPEGIGQWVDVEIFSVRDNRLTGIIPQSIANWRNLQGASFYHNNFTGTIPPAICELPTLVELNVDCLSEGDCSCCTCF